jgi:hypothetical protein
MPPRTHRLVVGGGHFVRADTSLMCVAAWAGSNDSSLFCLFFPPQLEPYYWPFYSNLMYSSFTPMVPRLLLSFSCPCLYRSCAFSILSHCSLSERKLSPTSSVPALQLAPEGRQLHRGRRRADRRQTQVACTRMPMDGRAIHLLASLVHSLMECSPSTR